MDGSPQVSALEKRKMEVTIRLLRKTKWEAEMTWDNDYFHKDFYKKIHIISHNRINQYC